MTLATLAITRQASAAITRHLNSQIYGSRETITPKPFFLAAREASACVLLFFIDFIMIITMTPNTMHRRFCGYRLKLLSLCASLLAKSAAIQEKTPCWQNAITRQF